MSPLGFRSVGRCGLGLLQVSCQLAGEVGDDVVDVVPGQFGADRVVHELAHVALHVTVRVDVPSGQLGGRCLVSVLR